IANARGLSARMRPAVVSLMVATAAAFASATPARADDLPTLPGEVLVKLRTAAALPTLTAKYALGVLAQFGSRPIYRLNITGTASVADTIAAPALEPDVLIAEANSLNA